MAQKSGEHFEKHLREQSRRRQPFENKIRKQKKSGNEARKIREGGRKNNQDDFAAGRRRRAHGKRENQQGNKGKKARKSSDNKGQIIFRKYWRGKMIYTRSSKLGQTKEIEFLEGIK